MKESKPHLQSDKLWFQKNNYPSEWLSEKSKKIIEQIKNKNMKKFIFTLLFPIFVFGQTYYDNALQFQNTVRSYYDAPLLSYNNDLALEAQAWAEYLAETDTFAVSSDNYGENIFYIDRIYANVNKKDVLLEATLNWIIDTDDWSTFNQIIYPEATNIGFGVAENNESIYVVAKYNKLYE
jgi:hypothetical protein